MVTLARRASRLPFAPVVGIMFGVVAAILMAATPQWLFERGVVNSGLPAVIAAASPPLGLFARLLAIAVSFLIVTVVLWAILGPLTAALEARLRIRTPWRDAGYDAPVPENSNIFIAPRKPIFAPGELGAPLMSDEAISVGKSPKPQTFTLDDSTGGDANKSDDSISQLIRRLEDGLAKRIMNDPDDPGGAGNAVAEPQADDDAVDGRAGKDADADASDGPAIKAENEPKRAARG